MPRRAAPEGRRRAVRPAGSGSTAPRGNETRDNSAELGLIDQLGLARPKNARSIGLALGAGPSKRADCSWAKPTARPAAPKAPP